MARQQFLNSTLLAKSLLSPSAQPRKPKWPGTNNLVILQNCTDSGEHFGAPFFCWLGTKSVVPSRAYYFVGGPMKTLACALLVLTVTSISTLNRAAAQEHSAAKQQLNWQAWSNQVFADAKREHRFVLLDLEA